MKDLGTIVAGVGLLITVFGGGIAWDKLDGRISALEDWGRTLQDRVTALEAQTQTQTQLQAPDPLVERCLELAEEANRESAPSAAATQSIMASLNCGNLKK